MNRKDVVIEILKSFNIPDSSYWADLELKEGDQAVLAMMRFLRPFQKNLDEYIYGYDQWIENSLNYHDSMKEIIEDMISAGVSHETIGRFAYWIARTSFNMMLCRLDDPAESDYDLENEGDGLPSWSLKEIILDQDGHETKESGRFISGMYEIFPFTNPID